MNQQRVIIFQVILPCENFRKDDSLFIAASPSIYDFLVTTQKVTLLFIWVEKSSQVNKNHSTGWKDATTQHIL